jgi:penicillin-binding protein 1A
VFTTKSGTNIKVNRSLTDKRKAHKDAIARQRAARLSSLPSNKFKRILYSLQPKRMAKYWFSREGAVMALKLAGVGIIVCFLLIVGLFAYFRKDLPKITDVDGNNLPGSVSYYDKTGQTLLWQDYDAVKRIPVTGDNIAQDMKDATVAIEDKDYYNHGAFNARGILRAAISNVTNSDGSVQGGSTITQQLVKLSENWTADRTYSRKVKELILAVELERSYSKQEILTGYLNLAPYGGIEVGVESAARDYFQTTAKDITLPQAAFLAAIPQAPSIYSPYSDLFEKDKLVGREHYILDRMAEQGMVTRDEAAAAKQVDVVATVKPLQPKYEGIKAPYFVLAAKDELEQTYLSKTTTLGGWKITTSLDMDLQKVAEDQVAKAMPQIKRQGGDDAAFVAEDTKTGEVVAAVGGADFSNADYGKLNFAHSVQVSPGSTFKPYDYTALIEKGTNVGGGSVLYDTQGALPGYPCTNKEKPAKNNSNNANCLWDYDFRYPGPLTLRYALGGSRNVPAVKAMLTVGTDKTINIANSLMAQDNAYKCYQPGTDVFTATKSDQTQCYGSSAIGDGAYVHLDDHVNGFTSLSRLGSAIPRTYIAGITDAKGKKVDLKKREAAQVVRPDSAYIVNDMASDNKASYLHGLNNCNGVCGFHDYKGWKFAIKTGTTNDGFDGLMASWSSRYASATWVGYHTRNKAMTGAMEVMTAPIVRGWMQAAHDKLGTKAENWARPTGVKDAAAFVIRNKVSSLGEVVPSNSNDIYPSWYTPPSGSSQGSTIDKVSQKLATSCTPDAAKDTATNGNANKFSVDQFVTGGTAITTEVDDVHKCDDTKPGVALTIASTSNGNPTTICDSDGCSITATVAQGTHPLWSVKFPGKLTISVNGNAIQSFDITTDASPQTFTATYKPSGSGAANVTAMVSDSVLYSTTVAQDITLSTSSSNNNGGNGNNH